MSEKKPTGTKKKTTDKKKAATKKNAAVKKVVKKKVVKKKAAVKKTVKKAAVKKAVKKKASKPAASKGAGITFAEYREKIALAAYFIAEKRLFENGVPEDDWMQAEKMVKAELKSKGIKVETSG